MREEGRGKLGAGAFFATAQPRASAGGELPLYRVRLPIAAGRRGAVSKRKTAYVRTMTRRGLVRHVYVRRAVNTTDAVAVIVASGASARGRRHLLVLYAPRLPELSGIVLNVNRVRQEHRLSPEIFTHLLGGARNLFATVSAA